MGACRKIKQNLKITLIIFLLELTADIMRAQLPLPQQVDQRTCQEELFPRQSANQPAVGWKRQLQIVRIICTCNRTHYIQ